MKLVLNSQTENENNENYFFSTISNQSKLFIYRGKNFVNNANLYERCYLIGNASLIASILFFCLIYRPLIIVLLILGIPLLSFCQKKDFWIQGIKEIKNWITYTRLLIIACISIIIILGGYLFFTAINSLGWLNFLSIIGIVSVSFGFILEFFYLWEKRNKIIDKAIYILGALSSFISLYLARCIIVNSTGLEPAIFSRASIIFSIFIAIVYWLILSILLLSLIYIWTVLAQLFIYLIDSWIKKKTTSPWIRFLLFKGGRGIGAGFLALFAFSMLAFIPYTYVVSPNYLTRIVENIIVYADYRPNTKVSECTNLKNNEWGLLVGNKKVSVAQTQKSGNYIFTTKPCLFSKDNFLE